MEGNSRQPIPFEGKVFKVVELSEAVVGGQTRAPTLKDDFPSGFGPFRGALTSFLPLNWPTEAPAPGSTSRRLDCFQTQVLKRALKIQGGAFSSYGSPLDSIWSHSLSLKLASAPAVEMARPVSAALCLACGFANPLGPSALSRVLSSFSWFRASVTSTVTPHFPSSARAWISQIVETDSSRARTWTLLSRLLGSLSETT